MIWPTTSLGYWDWDIAGIMSQQHPTTWYIALSIKLLDLHTIDVHLIFMGKDWFQQGMVMDGSLVHRILGSNKWGNPSSWGFQSHETIILSGGRHDSGCMNSKLYKSIEDPGCSVASLASTKPCETRLTSPLAMESRFFSLVVRNFRRQLKPTDWWSSWLWLTFYPGYPHHNQLYDGDVFGHPGHRAGYGAGR
jgi:hypothetical protein